MANNDGKGYTLGDLSFSLLFEDNSAINNINNMAKSLNSLVTPLKKIEKINLQNVHDKLQQIGKIDFSGVTNALTPLTNLSNVGNIKKVNNQIENTNKQLNKVNKTAEKTNISFNKVFSIGRLYFWINYTKRFAQALSRMMTRAIDFNETLNKFQVSMGQYYSRAIKYVNSLTYAFNLSTESIMNYQSTFMNMLSALGGLSSDTSYELSETLTRMAIDYASLFNVSIDRAMEQFQSVLSGQIKFSLASKGLLEKFTPLNNGKSKQVKL